ncbi:hypothetical protein [Ruegeria sp.]|uniref:hypothetical protein n=1 Tax=Ruegeria sp. TaxID=1879320 RepID=UPI003B00A347
MSAPLSPTRPAWPAYARIDPARQILPVTVVERTGFDDGAIRQVRRFTATPARRRIRAWLLGSREAGITRSPDEDLIRFRAWAGANAHRPFRFPDETGARVMMRVVGGDGGISYRAHVSPAGRRSWELEMELETT